MKKFFLSLFLPAHYIKNKKINIKIENGGGIGDVLIDLAFCKFLIEKFKRIQQINFYCKYPTIINNSKKIKLYHEKYRKQDTNNYDLYLKSHRFFIIPSMDAKKLKETSPLLHKWCESQFAIRSFLEKTSKDNNGIFTRFSELMGKDRYEQLDIYNILGFNVQNSLSLPAPNDKEKLLNNLGLKANKYITLNTDSGNVGSVSVKQWPLSHYEYLAAMIKKDLKGYKSVLLGKAKAGNINCDIDLTGKTNFEQLKVILKNSVMHVDMEGGLVHLRHALGRKSIVLFGPTSIETFGYPDNINIKGDGCKGNCHWLSPEWQDRCVKGAAGAPCMESISPEHIFNILKNYIDQSHA